MFNITDHIEYRKNNYSRTTISNPKLLGLAVVEINPTELCNRTCSFCPRSNPELYPNLNLNMTVETMEILIQQLKDADYNGNIHITGYGEPTLNPDILELIKISSKYFHTEIITNGDKLTNKKITHQQFKEAGLSTLIVDCYDGPEQIKQMTALLEDCKIYYRIRDHHDTGDSNLFTLYNYNNRGGLANDKVSLQRPCWLPFYKAFIDWDGEVRLCCNDWARAQKSFGNIHKNSFDKIWMSERFTKLRKILAVGDRSKLAACKGCNTDGKQNGKESVDLWD